jgi:GNAT superfamily N-acetyltransferase
MPTWHAEPNPARYDDAKRAFFSALPPGAVHVQPAGDLLPGRWWRLDDDQGHTVAYGWMDVTWGDAQILLAVHPDHQREGHGAVVLDHLADEAHKAGLSYLFNTIPADHPAPDAARAFLTANGFVASGLDGTLLRRKVG